MTQEWPIVKPSVEPGEPLLPLAMHEHVELVKASAAVAAFCEQRAVQMLPPFNHTPDADRELPIDQLVRAARDRLDAFLEITGRGLMQPPPDRRASLIRKIEVAGGLLIAAFERLHAEPLPEGEDL